MSKENVSKIEILGTWEDNNMTDTKKNVMVSLQNEDEEEDEDQIARGFPIQVLSSITRYSSRIAPINEALVRLAGCKAHENKT